ncbi:hypothetical protein, partial [Neisseria meningitidis]
KFQIPACAGMTAQKLRNEKQPKPDKSDSRLRGNDGILSFRLCFLFSVFEGIMGNKPYFRRHFQFGV